MGESCVLVFQLCRGESSEGLQRRVVDYGFVPDPDPRCDLVAAPPGSLQLKGQATDQVLRKLKDSFGRSVVYYRFPLPSGVPLGLSH